MHVAVIVGGAAGGPEEREEATALARACGLAVVSVAVNDSGTDHPNPLDHWLTLHPEKFPTWERRREANGLGAGYVKWSMPRRPRLAHEPGVRIPHHVDRVIAYRWKDASSGISAVELALNHLDVPAILCGVPMDATQNRHHGKAWGQARRYLRGYQKARTEFGDRVRSMSGRTRDDLGAPTAEWLLAACVPV